MTNTTQKENNTGAGFTGTDCYPPKEPEIDWEGKLTYFVYRYNMIGRLVLYILGSIAIVKYIFS